MDSMISIIYANRNRDLNRIKVTLDTLKSQSFKNFEVLFVDYGSDPNLVEQLSSLLNKYEFVRFFPLKVSQLLWNKSKALNYGLLKATGTYIFIADIDHVFHPDALLKMTEYSSPDSFTLFKMGYLDKDESKLLNKSFKFTDLKVARSGDVNGMILAPTEAFEKINGFDEFFHFYGSEDIDLFARLKHAGYKENYVKEKLIYHNWHSSFANAEDDKLTLKPRIKNIMRINQQHYKFNLENLVLKPSLQGSMGVIIAEKDSNKLLKPSKQFTIPNILAEVEHFLNFELLKLSNEIVQVVFFEDPYYSGLKYKAKKILGKQSQTYCSLKEINDKILKQIVYKYRDSNYSFKVADDLKSIDFRIQL
jgi:glycosyltransferase involved in cell wall biosynthesis